MANWGLQYRRGKQIHREPSLHLRIKKVTSEYIAYVLVHHSEYFDTSHSRAMVYPGGVMSCNNQHRTGLHRGVSTCYCCCFSRTAADT